jgi:hypothetical protein
MENVKKGFIINLKKIIEVYDDIKIYEELEKVYYKGLKDITIKTTVEETFYQPFLDWCLKNKILYDKFYNNILNNIIENSKNNDIENMIFYFEILTNSFDFLIKFDENNFIKDVLIKNLLGNY